MAAEPLHKTLWQGNQALAEECLAHPFVRGLGDGTLDPEVFKHYLAQDAFFLQGARIKGCVKERRRTFPLTINQRVPGCHPGERNVAS